MLHPLTDVSPPPDLRLAALDNTAPIPCKVSVVQTIAITGDNVYGGGYGRRHDTHVFGEGERKDAVPYIEAYAATTGETQTVGLVDARKSEVVVDAGRQCIIEDVGSRDVGEMEVKTDLPSVEDRVREVCL